MLPDNLQRYQQGLAAVVIAASLLFLLSFTWHSWQRLQPPTVTDSAPVAPRLPSKPVHSDYALFGRATKASIPESRLQVSIKGLYSAKSTQHSYAILAVQGQADKVFYVGDKITDNAKLVEITVNAIVIERDGQREKIRLPRMQLPMRAAPKSPDEVN